MTNKNDNHNSYFLDFFGKECKNNYHNQCSGLWEGFGFKIVCNCECHRRQSLEKNIIYSDSSNKKTVRLES